jgi:hypothetical protein
VIAMTEPGTGEDWRNALAPAGMRPVGPRTTDVRPWAEIPGNDVPTDAERLAWLEDQAAGELTAESARAQAEAAELRRLAAAGYHDGSLPELGAYRPVYFERVDSAD